MAINKNLTLKFEAVNDYPPIRFEIRFEQKFPIRRSLQKNYALQVKRSRSTNQSRMQCIMLKLQGGPCILSAIMAVHLLVFFCFS